MSLEAPVVLHDKSIPHIGVLIVSLESHGDVCIIYKKLINLEAAHAPTRPVPKTNMRPLTVTDVTAFALPRKCSRMVTLQSGYVRLIYFLYKGYLDNR